MIELKANRAKIGAIRCSGRASDVTGSSAPFAIVSVELSDANDPTAPFEVAYDDPECVNQAGEKYADVEEEKYLLLVRHVELRMQQATMNRLGSD